MNIPRPVIYLLILALFLVTCGCNKPFHTKFTISQDAVVADTLFVIDQDDRILRRSFDGGVTFEPTGMEDRPVYAVTSDSTSLYAVLEDGQRFLYQSDDLGATFVVELDCSDVINDIDNSSDGSVYAAIGSWGRDSGIKRKRNGDWQTLIQPGSFSYTAIDVNPDKPDVLFALSEPGGGYSFRWITTSRNGGLVWLPLIRIESIFVRFDRSYRYYGQ